MIGNVEQLAIAIAQALDVPHGAVSQREVIAQGIANGIAAYLATVTVSGTTTGGVCPATTSPHIPLTVEGVLQ